MKFGPIAIADAKGALLVHSIRREGLNLKKGRLLEDDDLAALRGAGIETVVAARFEAGDVPEDTAAARLAATFAGPGIRVASAFTGRANIFAEEDGVMTVDRDAIDAVNRIDEAITIATLPDYAAVGLGQMLATVKIIPFAAPAEAVEQAMAILEERQPFLRLHPFRPLVARLIQTALPDTSTKMLDKTARITEERMAAVGGSLAGESRCAHDAEALAPAIAEARQAGGDLLLISGASAITDRRDVLPAGIEAAGGTIEHFGMPVDPGNLLLLGHFGPMPVLGLPGCARSPKINGFDWVLQRLATDLEVDRAAIMGMGVGGLLVEIPTRPQPRAVKPSARSEPRIAVLVLAAGQSRRMGGPNKLLIPIDGKPMLRHTVEAALASKASDVIVVTGHQHEAVETVLEGTAVRIVNNPAYADGLSTSLKAGIAALPPRTDAVLVCLGDMPEIDAELIDRLIGAFDPEGGRAIVVPTHNGKRGNPVLWGSAFFSAMLAIEGDVGARHLIGQHAEAVTEIACDRGGSLVDIDTPESLDAYLAGHR